MVSTRPPNGRNGGLRRPASGYLETMIATAPILIVIVLLLALVSLIIVPGAALLAIPLVIVLALVLIVGAARGAAASRGGRRVTEKEPGESVGEALSSPESESRDTVAASRERTQG